MDMYLVYEKNYAIDDVDCIEECEMKLYSSLEAAKREISKRKESYEREILYTFLPSESSFLPSESSFLPSKSSEKCLLFAVNYNEKEDTYDGAFCVCLCKIPVEK